MDQRAPITLLRRTLALLAPAATLAIAGCGEGPPADPRSGEVIRVVGAFANADGAQACELLTEAALERLYGGLEGCLARAESFEGGEVKVEEVEIVERGSRAIAQARSLGGRDRFTVTARLVAPPGCGEPCPDAVWRISEVKLQR